MRQYRCDEAPVYAASGRKKSQRAFDLTASLLLDANLMVKRSGSDTNVLVWTFVQFVLYVFVRCYTGRINEINHSVKSFLEEKNEQ